MSAETTRIWTVLELLRWTQDFFGARGIDTARLDAECLLAHALATDRLGLYTSFDKPVEADERSRFRELVRRRADERVPVAQLTGRKEFWSLSLAVSPDVLVPRPETETLVSVAVALVPEREAELRVLDLGTGSGAVALALASELPKLRILASDVSERALDQARANAEALGFVDRIRFVRGDGFEPLAGERFDLIVSNPPYLAEAAAADLAPELAHEPREALFAGADGSRMLRRIAAEAGEFLEPGGAVAVELAPDQAAPMQEWFTQAGLGKTGVHRDLAGRARVVVAFRERAQDEAAGEQDEAAGEATASPEPAEKG